MWWHRQLGIASHSSKLTGRISVCRVAGTLHQARASLNSRAGAVRCYGNFRSEPATLRSYSNGSISGRQLAKPKNISCLGTFRKFSHNYVILWCALLRFLFWKKNWKFAFYIETWWPRSSFRLSSVFQYHTFVYRNFGVTSDLEDGDIDVEDWQWSAEKEK